MPRLGRMSGALPAALLAIPLMAATVAPATPSAADAVSTPAALQKITWKPCPDDPRVQCGRLSVPIDWAHPEKGRIQIAVARAKARKPAKRLGALLVNPGGPGESGVDLALDAPYTYSTRLRDRFDIVGFDPRGVARSHPVRCGNLKTLGKPPNRDPRNQRQFVRLRNYQAKVHQACRAKTGLLYDFLGADSVARDMEALRLSLGESKLNYLGVSYGTWFGQRYAELFPGQIRAMALDSNMNHATVGAARFTSRMSRGLEISYREFNQWCRRNKHCALRGKSTVKVLDRLMARAERGKLHDIGRPRSRLTAADLRSMVHNAMYDPRAWPGLSQELKELDKQRPRKTPAPPPERPSGAFAALLCPDWSLPVRNYRELAAVKRAARKEAPHVRISPLAWDAVTGCLGRSASDPQRPYRVKGAPPILLTNSRYDPATAHQWGYVVADRIPRSVLLTYGGTGHGTYQLSRCTRRAIDTYLLTLRTPKAGARRCPAEWPDFNRLEASRTKPTDELRRF